MRKLLSILVLVGLFLCTTHAQDYITRWKTDNPGLTGPNTIRITCDGSFTINWFEVSNPANNGSQAGSGPFTDITFPNPGIYEVSISGGLNYIRLFNTDVLKIISIEQWGNIVWTQMESAYRNCANLHINATDAPDLSMVTDLQQMFRDCSSMNESLDHWDVSTITSMQNLFYDATSFNQPLNNWNVSNVTDMVGMFFGASAFNQDLSNWNTADVTDMSAMFFFATSFNQDITGWMTSSLINMNGMFTFASAFDQDLGTWDISNVQFMNSVLSNSGLSQPNYDATLIGWAGQSVQPNVNMGANGLEYCFGQSARDDTLITDNGWTISGDSFVCNICPTDKTFFR